MSSEIYKGCTNTLGTVLGPFGTVASNIPLAFIFLIFTFSLDAVLSALSDLSSEPFSSMSAQEYQGISEWKMGMARCDRVGREKFEVWTAPKDDSTNAWTFGTGWACCEVDLQELL